MGKFQTIWKFFFKDSKKEQGNTNHPYATQWLSRTQCTEGLLTVSSLHGPLPLYNYCCCKWSWLRLCSSSGPQLLSGSLTGAVFIKYGSSLILCLVIHTVSWSPNKNNTSKSSTADSIEWRAKGSWCLVPVAENRGLRGTAQGLYWKCWANLFPYPAGLQKFPQATDYTRYVYSPGRAVSKPLKSLQCLLK